MTGSETPNEDQTEEKMPWVQIEEVEDRDHERRCLRLVSVSELQHSVGRPDTPGATDMVMNPEGQKAADRGCLFALVAIFLLFGLGFAAALLMVRVIG